jgi:hypothetical protein
VTSRDESWVRLLVVVSPLAIAFSVSFRNAGQLLSNHFAGSAQLIATSPLKTTRVLVRALGASLERHTGRPSALSSAGIVAGFVRLGIGRNGEKECGHTDRARDSFHVDSFQDLISASDAA